MRDTKRYLRIENWLYKRYQRSPGIMDIIVKGKPTLYKRLERLFFDKYVIGVIS